MSSTRKHLRLLVIAFCCVAFASLAACSGGSSSDDSGTSDGFSVALVTPEKAGDGGPTDQMLAGLAKAKKEFGLKTRHIEATDPSTYESTLTNLGQAKTNVVIVAFTQFADSVKAVAPKFPDTKFVYLYADAYKPGIDNVETIAYDTNGPAYLAGVLAASASKSGKVGFIGGLAIPQVNADYHAFEAGVKATNPDASIAGGVVGSFSDSVKGQQVAQRMFAGGIDYVLAYAGGASLGAVKAAQQNKKALVIYDGQVSDAVADAVPATATQQFGTTIYNELKKINEDTWKAGHLTAGLVDGGTVLDESPAFAEAGPADGVATLGEAFPKVEAAKKSIIGGSIKVPFDTKGF